MILDRFCLHILPKICDTIECLDLGSSSMKHILRTTHYPNLYTLGLYNIDEKSVRSLFTDEILSSDIFKNQITRLLITINKNDDYGMMLEIQSFNDCLHLLDGRFNQLHTLYVDLVNLRRPHEIQNQGNLPNLKCFSLSCVYATYYYNETILPLLYRMSNLEELDLYFSVEVDETFIDGNYLKKNIINRMTRLNQFTFYIPSIMSTRKEMNFPSTEDIQLTFIDFPANKIISYVDYFPEIKQSRCHIYSYPSFMPYYGDITNNFPGGLFQYVRVVSLYDEHPFEHEFFLRIVQSFPFMEKLSLKNNKSQNRKQSYESNNDNQNFSVIEYSFLSELVIIDVHDDYIEEFLFDTKTYLQNNIILQINYESLQRVTHNFTTNAARIHSTKISKLYLYGKTKCSNSCLQEYFPYAKICYPDIF
ncbi:unnamed protein product [Rotaria sordida]|uniref:F-box domain-containing protein n=1 Tax=Rotaria sordida TaxID=392033 RepID=A0A815PBL7_9BILA|nr:unnamed protein product [Rotaria sordida]CAF4033399.1 unnamed protein product [Rotaria sordida]